VEPARDDLPRRVVEQLADRVDHDREDLVSVLLDPSLAWMAVDLVAAGLADGLKALVEERGLDAGRSLVDAQQQPVAHADPLPTTPPATSTVTGPASGSTWAAQSAGLCPERPGIRRGSRPRQSIR